MEASRNAGTLGVAGAVLVVVLPIALAVWIVPGWVTAERGQDQNGMALSRAFAIGLPYLVASWLTMAVGAIAV